MGVLCWCNQYWYSYRFILRIAKESIPNKTVCVRPDDKPWFSNQLRKLLRNKSRLHRKAKCKNTPEAWALFRAARNDYIRNISAAKHEYENIKYDRLCDNDMTSKEWWSIVKEVQSANEFYSGIPPIEVGNLIITDYKDKASSFNDFSLKHLNLMSPTKWTKHLRCWSWLCKSYNHRCYWSIEVFECI